MRESEHTGRGSSLGVATLGRRDILGGGDALGDRLGNLDLDGLRHTRWTSVNRRLRPCPLVNGLGERQTPSKSLGIGESGIFVLLNVLIVIKLGGTLLEEMTLGSVVLWTACHRGSLGDDLGHLGLEDSRGDGRGDELACQLLRERGSEGERTYDFGLLEDGVDWSCQQY